jgi:hypothetical protein
MNPANQNWLAFTFPDYFPVTSPQFDNMIYLLLSRGVHVNLVRCGNGTVVVTWNKENHA